MLDPMGGSALLSLSPCRHRRTAWCRCSSSRQGSSWRGLSKRGINSEHSPRAVDPPGMCSCCVTRERYRSAARLNAAAAALTRLRQPVLRTSLAQQAIRGSEVAISPQSVAAPVRRAACPCCSCCCRTQAPRGIRLLHTHNALPAAGGRAHIRTPKASPRVSKPRVAVGGTAKGCTHP